MAALYSQVNVAVEKILCKFSDGVLKLRKKNFFCGKSFRRIIFPLVFFLEGMNRII